MPRGRDERGRARQSRPPVHLLAHVEQPSIHEGEFRRIRTIRG